MLPIAHSWGGGRRILSKIMFLNKEKIKMKPELNTEEEISKIIKTRTTY